MDDGDAAMDEDIACNSIPITNFKSNNIQKKERFIQPVGAMSPGGAMSMNAPMSPGAGFAMRDWNFKSAIPNGGMGGGALSPRSDGGGYGSHCVCGLPMRPD
jgi:hypothetical protein